MNAPPDTRRPAGAPDPGEMHEAPFLHAAEDVTRIHRVMLCPALAVLAAGTALFGWRAAATAAVAAASCVAFQWLCWRMTRRPELRRHEQAWLTGTLLALTLPPFVPWYVPVIAAAFAVGLGAAPGGLVRRGLWQGVLIGRLAVAVILPDTVINPQTWPVLLDGHSFGGDITRVAPPSGADPAPHARAPHARRAATPRAILSALTDRSGSCAAMLRVEPGRPPGQTPVINRLPAPYDLIFGARAGPIGGTCAAMLLAVGVYLIYRNYVRWYVPAVMLAAAWCAAAAGPVWLAGPDGAVRTVWVPLLAEGADVGLLYCACQMLGGDLLLAALLVAVSMTTRPIGPWARVIFAAGCGALVMAGQMYTTWGPSAFAAVAVMETLTPALDALWRRRAFGMRR